MIYALIVFIIVFAIFLWLDCKKPENFPPGPKWIPILGSALSLSKARNKTGMLIKGIDLIAKSYPEAQKKGILGFKVGKDRIVMTIGRESILEMMSNEAMDGRPTGPFYETRTWGLRRGILLVDEEFWQAQRRFIVRHLKEFGFARKGMVEIIQNEAEFCMNDLLHEIRLQGGEYCLIKMQKFFSLYVLNTLWQMMAGIRYTPENKELKTLQSLLHQLFLSIDMMGAPFSHFPFLSHIFPKLSGYTDFVNTHNEMFDFIGKEVENHKKTFNINDEPRDLIDVYLKILSSVENNNTLDDSKNPFPPNFTEKEMFQQLLAVCLDFFMAGSETTTKTLSKEFIRNFQHTEMHLTGITVL